MRLSLQNASIISGVILVHLFAIAAILPVEGEWPGTLPKIEIDPALTSLFDEVVTGLQGEEKTEPAVTGYPSAEPVVAIQEDSPAGESAPGEMTDLRINPVAEESVKETLPSPPSKDLAETHSAKEAPTGSTDVAALEPPRQIRQIRSLQATSKNPATEHR